MVTLIDSHAHLGDQAFTDDRADVLMRAQEAGVVSVVNICTDLQTLQTGLALKAEYPWIHLAAASTPHDVGEKDPFFEDVRKHADALVAIGETGLDYHYEHSPREHQKIWLQRYLALAHTHALPVVIHCREAFADFFQILDEGPRVPGVLHCFTGTTQEARGVIERGWYLSLSGIVTYKKSAALREVAAWVPLDQLLIETDAPYLAPQTRRGKRNEPAYVAEIARVIAETKGLSHQVVAETTTANAARLFGILLD